MLVKSCLDIRSLTYICIRGINWDYRQGLYGLSSWTIWTIESDYRVYRLEEFDLILLICLYFKFILESTFFYFNISEIINIQWWIIIIIIAIIIVIIIIVIIWLLLKLLWIAIAPYFVNNSFLFLFIKILVFLSY